MAKYRDFDYRVYLERQNIFALINTKENKVFYPKAALPYVNQLVKTNQLGMKVLPRAITIEQDRKLREIQKRRVGGYRDWQERRLRFFMLKSLDTRKRFIYDIFVKSE